MQLSNVIAIAWKGLNKNRLRSLLTMLGVIIGVAAVIIMIAISAGTEATISERITSLGANLIYIQGNFVRGGPGMGGGGGGSAGGLTYDDAFAIEEAIDGVAGVAVEQNSTAIVKAGSVTIESVSLVGTTPSFPSVRDMSIASGRFFTQRDLDRKLKAVVLGASLTEELFGETDPVGQTVTVGNYKLTVIGVLAPRGIASDTDFDARLYMPVTVLFEKYLPSFMARVLGNSVRLINVKVEPGADMESVILQTTLLLAKRHNVSMDSLDFTITTQQDIIDTQAATTAAFRNLLTWVAAVSLLVGGIGIMNIMLVSVTERTREIGIRQSVGASPNDIRSQFLTEALLLSLVGGLIGVAAGVGGSWLFGRFGEMRTVVLPESILLAFGSAAAVGIFFGYYPANKAAQLDPIEALRHE